MLLQQIEVGHELIAVGHSITEDVGHVSRQDGGVDHNLKLGV